VDNRPVPDQGMQARIAGEHFPTTPGGGIAIENDRNVFAKSIKHACILTYPTKILNYSCGHAATGSPQEDSGNEKANRCHAHQHRIDHEKHKRSGDGSEP